MSSHFPVVIYSITAALIAAWLVFVMRRFVHIDSLKIHHEVGFPIFLQIGVIYGVLLAFIFSMTWEQFSKVEQDITLESSNLIEVFELSIAFPPEIQQKIRDTTKNYMNRVIHVEWDRMREGDVDPEARLNLDRLFSIYANYEPTSKKEQTFYTQSLNHLSDIREYRSMRIFQVHSSRLFRLISLIGILGAGLVAISFFFGMEVIWVQSILTAALTATIASIVGMIVLLTQPFSGTVAIEPSIFEDALTTMQNFDAAHPISKNTSPMV